MIKHTIVVHKPRIKAPVYPILPQKQPQHNVGNFVNGRPVVPRKFTNDIMFQNWVNTQLPFNKTGMVLAMNPEPITELRQCHLIVEIKRDYAMLDWETHTGLPLCLKLVQMREDIQPVPWIRWDSPSGYRFLSEDEIKRVIEPMHDKVSYYRSTYLEPKEPSSV